MLRDSASSIEVPRPSGDVAKTPTTPYVRPSERVELLKRLYLDGGLRASQIADRLGGVTRNVVIGKVHRLGLPGRPTQRRRHQNRLPRNLFATHTMSMVTGVDVATEPLSEAVVG